MLPMQKRICFYPFLRSQTQPNWTFSRPEKIHSWCSFNLTLRMEVKLLASFIYTSRQAADGQYSCTLLLNKMDSRAVFLWLDQWCQNNCRFSSPSICILLKYTVFVYTCVWSFQSKVMFSWHETETLYLCIDVCVGN